MILNTIILILFAILPFGIEKNLGGIWITTVDLLVILLLLFWVFQLLTAKKGLGEIDFPLAIPILLLLLTFVLSVSEALNPLFSVREIVKFLGIFLLFVFFVNNVKERALLPKILYVILASTTLMSAHLIIYCVQLSHSALLDMLLRTRVWERGFLSPLHLNLVGAILATAIPLELFCFSNSRTILQKVLVASGVCIQIVALILSYSRGNWIALSTVLFLMFILKKKLRGAFVSLCVVVLPLITVLLLFPKIDLANRIFSIVDSKEGSIVSRLDHIRSGLMLMKSKPLTGVGIGNFQIASEKYLGKQVTEIAHNMFLQCVVDGGIFCLLFMLILLGTYMFDSVKILNSVAEEKTLYQILFCGVFAFSALILSGQFGDPFVRYTKEYFSFLLALPYVINNLHSKSKLGS